MAKIVNVEKSKKATRFIYNLPIAIWMSIFFALPTLIIVYYSFLKKKAYGGVDPLKVTLASYQKIFTSTDILFITLKTLHISAIITLVTVALALPTAYFISKSRYKNVWLLLIIIPFWTNLIVRIFSFIAILGNNGLLNRMLMSLLKLQKPIELLYNKNAVVIISVYVFLPYAILPLYSTIEKFDFSLIEVARDLGANKLQAFIKVFLPGIKGGLVTAVLFVFIPAIGSYAIPDLVGGTDGMMLGNVIYNQMTNLRDWPAAAVISTVIIIIISIAVLFSTRKRKEVD